MRHLMAPGGAVPRGLDGHEAVSQAARYTPFCTGYASRFSDELTIDNHGPECGWRFGRHRERVADGG